MVTVLEVVGLERIVLDGKCAVECMSGTDCVGCQMCCSVWAWNV
jgi:hypothetical protein